VNRVLRNICFEHIDTYRLRGAETISLTYTDSCEKVGNGYPFHSNILFNNIADFIVIITMIILKTSYMVFVPTMLLLFAFYKIQKYYRSNIHNLEDISKFCEVRLL
jgi:hypothetical protein